MKKLSFILLVVLSFGLLNAQQINGKGLYVTSDGVLFNGVITSHVNDVKFKLTVKEGIVAGDAEYFYASGKLMEIGTFTDGKKDQKWTRYNENGSISAVAFYTLGKKTGTWLVYDDTGKKRFEMNYNNGEKTGTWTNWDENGMVVNTKNYNPN
jgi:antitoxin component YwqK of YwqJK toxin-antitoxin module